MKCREARRMEGGVSCMIPKHDVELHPAFAAKWLGIAVIAS